LGRLAETFWSELELERQFGLQGPEWTAYFKQKRQMILDEIQRVESGEEDLHIPPLTQGHNLSTIGLPHTVSPMQPKRSVHPFILPENKGTLAFTSIQCDT
jgi:hypothetical protein